MTIPVTLNLPDEIYQRAERFARLANRDLASILTDTVVLSLPPLSDQIDALPSMMQIYNKGWLRKTAGLVEAVKRGLMEPMAA